MPYCSKLFNLPACHLTSSRFVAAPAPLGARISALHERCPGSWTRLTCVTTPARYCCLAQLQGIASDMSLQHSRHFDTGCIWLVGNGDSYLRSRRPFFRNPLRVTGYAECALSRLEWRTYAARTSFKARFPWGRNVFESLANSFPLATKGGRVQPAAGRETHRWVLLVGAREQMVPARTALADGKSNLVFARDACCQWFIIEAADGVSS
jgi:hypothetical protein